MNMQRKLGLQLYSLREQLSADFERTLEEVARAGYKEVELAGLHQQKPERVAQLLNDLNLKLVAMHCDVISYAGLQQSLETAAALNCHNLICPWRPPETFENEKGIRHLSEQLNRANLAIKEQGKNLLYHNHDFEFRKLNGNCVFNLFEKYLDPSIHFELDTYLATVGGCDPIEIMTLFPNRIKMLHLKDGLISPPNPNVAVGDGNMNYKAILSALPQSVNFIFVEFEDCATDMFHAVRKSAKNLVNILNADIS